RDAARVTLHPIERRRELAEPEPDREERHPEPERVGDEEHRRAKEVLALRRERQHGAEHGADTRRPTKAERNAGNRLRHRPEALEVRMETELLIEARRHQQL